MKTKKYFPLFMDLNSKKVMVVGGGTIAERRFRTLLDFVEAIWVIAPEISDGIRDLKEQGRIFWKKKRYEREDIYDADLVLAATDDRKVNEDIYSACKCLGILVNTASDRRKCDFYFPGILLEEDVVMGFNSGGDPVKSREMRRKVERLLHQPGGKE